MADAFEEHSLSEQRFDIVIGNPPWKSKLSSSAVRFVKRQHVPIADNQIASAFLWLAALMLRPGGTLGLVMPAQALLHNRSPQAERFRTAIFSRLRVRVVADLSAIRRIIFKEAAGPASIIVAELPDPQSAIDMSRHDDSVLYVSAHPRPLSSAVDALAIAPEEVRSISRKLAEGRPEIWNTLVWGTERDIELVDRLRISFAPLEALTLERGWITGQGYQVAGGDENDASHLFGFPIIPTEAVERLHVRGGFRDLFRLHYIHRPRNVGLYHAPHVLIKRTIAGSRISAALSDEDAVFPNGVVGIAGPDEDKPLLAAVAAVLSSSLGLYWQFMTSAFWGKERDAVELGEYLSLPLPYLADAQAREFLVFSGSSSEDSADRDALLDDMVFNLYQLAPEDRARVRNFASSDLPRFATTRRQYASPSTDEWLQGYCDVIAETLQSAFGNMAVRSFFERRDSYCTAVVVIGDQAITQVSEEKSPHPTSNIVTVDIDQIIQDQRTERQYNTGVFALPTGLYVEDDTIYIVKTSDRDRWSRDAALDDADRIFAALAFGS